MLAKISLTSTQHANAVHDVHYVTLELDQRSIFVGTDFFRNVIGREHFLEQYSAQLPHILFWYVYRLWLLRRKCVQRDLYQKTKVYMLIL